MPRGRGVLPPALGLLSVVCGVLRFLRGFFGLGLRPGVEGLGFRVWGGLVSELRAWGLHSSGFGPWCFRVLRSRALLHVLLLALFSIYYYDCYDHELLLKPLGKNAVKARDPPEKRLRCAPWKPGVFVELKNIESHMRILSKWNDEAIELF